jgi:hypothetical protein
VARPGGRHGRPRRHGAARRARGPGACWSARSAWWWRCRPAP